MPNDVKNTAEVQRPHWLWWLVAMFYLVAIISLGRIYWGSAVVPAVAIAIIAWGWGWLFWQRSAWIYKVTRIVAPLVLAGMVVGLLVGLAAIVFYFMRQLLPILLGLALILLAVILVTGPVVALMYWRLTRSGTAELFDAPVPSLWSSVSAKVSLVVAVGVLAWGVNGQVERRGMIDLLGETRSRIVVYSEEQRAERAIERFTAAARNGSARAQRDAWNGYTLQAIEELLAHDDALVRLAALRQMVPLTDRSDQRWLDLVRRLERHDPDSDVRAAAADKLPPIARNVPATDASGAETGNSEVNSVKRDRRVSSIPSRTRLDRRPRLVQAVRSNAGICSIAGRSAEARAWRGRLSPSKAHSLLRFRHAAGTSGRTM